MGWQGLTFKRHRGENLIPDNGLCQWGHIQTTEALLYKGQFLLIWTTLVLCSEQRLCDFYLRLWCKIRRIVNRFHWCPAPVFFSPLLFFRHAFNLSYGTMGSKKKQQKGKGSRTSQRWHFNSCWADKNNTTINGALWTHLKVMLGAWDGGIWRQKEKKKKIQSNDVTSAASVNGYLNTQGQRKKETCDDRHVRIKHLWKWARREKKNYTQNPFPSSLLSFVYFWAVIWINVRSRLG